MTNCPPLSDLYHQKENPALTGTGFNFRSGFAIAGESCLRINIHLLFLYFINNTTGTGFIPEN